MLNPELNRKAQEELYGKPEETERPCDEKMSQPCPHENEDEPAKETTELEPSEPEEKPEAVPDEHKTSETQTNSENASFLCKQMAQLQQNLDAMKRENEEQLSKICAALTGMEATLAQPKQDSTEENRLEMLIPEIAEIKTKLDRNDGQLTKVLRQNADFQIQVRQGMQKDLDKLKSEQTGEQFVPILSSIAEVFADYHFILDNELPPQLQHNLEMMFDQLKEILEDNDAEVCMCQEGDTRPSRQCRVIEKIPTGDKEKHNTVARSRKPGVVRGKKVLQQEFVDLYVYDESLDTAEPASETPQPTSDSKTATDPAPEQPAEAEIVGAEEPRTDE